jgi:hypothetical protein
MIVLGLGGLLGSMIALVAIAMEKIRLWGSHEIYVWFAISFVIVIIPYQYFCWKWCYFEIKKQVSKDA